MKSVLNNGCCKGEKPFPKLMKSSTSGAIFLMQSHTRGVVVHSKTIAGTSVGVFYDNIAYHYLSDYEGSVTLCND